MNQNQMKELLSKLADIQKSCAPITLSIGSLSNGNQVEHNTVVLIECPPIVIQDLIRDKYTLDLTKNGISIESNFR